MSSGAPSYSNWLEQEGGLAWILGWCSQATTDLAQKVETRPIQRAKILESDQLLLYYYFSIIIIKSRVNVKRADGLTVTLQSAV